MTSDANKPGRGYIYVEMRIRDPEGFQAVHGPLGARPFEPLAADISCEEQLRRFSKVPGIHRESRSSSSTPGSTHGRSMIPRRIRPLGRSGFRRPSFVWRCWKVRLTASWRDDRFRVPPRQCPRCQMCGLGDCFTTAVVIPAFATRIAGMTTKIAVVGRKVRLFPGRCYACTARCRPYAALCAVRSGFSTANAMIAATAFMIAPITNTACQLPVAVISMLPNGTSSEAVPFAV